MIPETMKHIDFEQAGEPSVMTVVEGAVPEIASDQILLKVAAAGVNRPDVIQRQGFYPPPPGASPILGLEVSGEVVAIGDAVKTWQIGDQVCALANGGGYAEYVALPAEQCLPIPEGLSLIEAASLPETHFTVWFNVMMRGQFQAGESLLVHGGSSGIGTCAIQMAKALGHTVYTTAGSETKCQACTNLGADLAINYREDDFVKAIKAHAASEGTAGVDVILDMVGGDYIQKNIKIAAPDGRIMNIAYLNGSTAEVNFMHVMLKRLSITGSTLRPQSDATKARIAKELLETVWPLYANQSMRPVIAKTFPLHEAAAAHTLMESNQHIGKIVLTL